MSGTKTLDEHNKAVMASCVRLTGISGTGGHTSADLATFLEAYSAERAARLKAEADLDAFIHEGTPDAVQHLTTRALRAEGRAARAERALEEREADMHNRIRAGYDATVADSWRARVAELESDRATLLANLATLRKRAGLCVEAFDDIGIPHREARERNDALKSWLAGGP